MTISYEAGAAAAVLAGFAFNLGLVLQKVAVSRIPRGRPLVAEMIRSPLWVAGLLTQFVIGTPLNLLAALRVGPAIVPGLLATGLIVLAIGAVFIARESLGVADVIGIVLVGAAIALFGLSRLAVDMSAFPVWEPAFLIRLAVFSGLAAAALGLTHLLLATALRRVDLALALDSGLLYMLSNLWIAVAIGMARSLFAGEPEANFFITAGAALLAAGTSALGVLLTQRAFQVADASRVVPIQQVPQQALPLVVYLAVFLLPPPSTRSMVLAGAGVAAIIVGASLLGRRQAAVR